jgi:hypothetical protein
MEIAGFAPYLVEPLTAKAQENAFGIDLSVTSKYIHRNLVDNDCLVAYTV